MQLVDYGFDETSNSQKKQMSVLHHISSLHRIFIVYNFWIECAVSLHLLHILLVNDVAGCSDAAPEETSRLQR